MIEFEKYNNKTTDAFAVIEEDGVYAGRLYCIKLSKQNEKFVEAGQEPRDQITFMFDIVNENGDNVHVATKAMGISFTDRSNLPKFFEKIAKIESGSDMSKLLYADKGLGKVFKVMVSVDKKDDKIYNTVTKITGVSNKEIEPTPLTEWDLRVYGQPCIEFDLAEGYKEPTESTTDVDDDEFLSTLANGD